MWPLLIYNGTHTGHIQYITMNKARESCSAGPLCKSEATWKDQTCSRNLQNIYASNKIKRHYLQALSLMLPIPPTDELWISMNCLLAWEQLFFIVKGAIGPLTKLIFYLFMPNYIFWEKDCLKYQTHNWLIVITCMIKIKVVAIDISLFQASYKCNPNVKRH